MKDLFKQIRRICAFWALRAVLFVPMHMPLKPAYIIGRGLGVFVYLVLGRHRRVAVESLTTAFPGMSLKEKKNVARQFFIGMAQGGLELLYFIRHPQAMESVRIEGKENLDKVLAAGKGALIVTAHFGNFPLLGLKLARAGYPVNFMARPMRDPQTDNYIHNLRENAGVKTILSYPRRECVSTTINRLRANEVVVLQMDQNFGTGGVWVKFFGHPAATPVGPIVFAVRTGAAIVPAYIYREKDDKHCLRILPPLELNIKEDKDETLLVNAITISRLFEGWIRQYPHEWSWIHRRWKSRPDERAMAGKFRVEK